MRSLAPLARLVRPVAFVVLSALAGPRLASAELAAADAAPTRSVPASARLLGAKPPVAAAEGSELSASASLVESSASPSRPSTSSSSSGPGPVTDAISATTYPLTVLAGVALEDMSTGTTLLVGPNIDDDPSAVFSFSFEFFLNGGRATQFSANANGLMRLGAAAVGSTFTNSLASVTNVPQIAPYWDDLYIGTNGKVHAKVVGTAPNRKLIVEWTGMQIPRVATATPGAGTFQAWIFETTGQIQFVYGSGIAANTGGASIGFGTAAAVFASVTASASTVSYATANDTNTAAIAGGTSYQFTPVQTQPAAPTNLTFTNVTAGQITLNWVDNSTNELGFPIYLSTDNVTFNYLGNAAANATNVTITGLVPGTTYFFRVYSVTEAIISTGLTGSQATPAATFSGTKSVGPTGDFASLTAAISAINAAGLSGAAALELQGTYVSTVETFPVAFPLFPGTSATNTVTVRPATGATALSITSVNTTATVDLNAAANVILDGRPGGAGTAKQLTIDNTATAGLASLRFINDANKNTVQFCVVRGAATSATGGVVVLSTSGGGAGNSSNVIDNCDVRESTAGFPTNGLYSLGTSGAFANAGNTLSNSNVFNFFSATAVTNGVLISTGNTTWTISANRFYQDATRTYTTGATHMGIQVNGSAGVGHQILNNVIGFASSTGTGTYTMAGTVATRFIGITLFPGVTTATSVQGNTIAGFSLTTSSGASTANGVWCGINVGSASFNSAVNVGNLSANTIGSGTVADSVLVTSTGTGSLIVGINSTSFTTTGSPFNFSNNVIGGFGGGGTAAIGIATKGILINAGLGDYTVSGNAIGSLTLANSIRAGIAGTTTAACIATGIENAGTGVTSIANNTIANLTANGVSVTTTALVRGINNTGGNPSITGNTIRNLTNVATHTTTGVGAPLVGISQASTVAGQTVSRNVIHSLFNNGTTAVTTNGIAISGPTTGTNLVARNFIHSLVPGAATHLVNGIAVAAGTTTHQNNMIRLGVDPAGASITVGAAFSGIFEPLGTDNFYFNSVFVGGTGVVSSLNTYAFQSTQTVNARVYQNNIFVNARSNASGTGKNYAVRVGGTTANPTGLTINYNVYQATGTGGVFGFFNSLDVASLDAWRTAVGQDANSISADPKFLAPNGTSATVNLHIDPTSPTPVEAAGLAIAGITDDFDGDVRANFTSTDIGADAGNFIGVDLSPPVISYTALAATSSTANRTLANVAVTDNTGVATAAGVRPRVYFRRSTDTNAFNDNTPATAGWKYVEATGAGGSPFSFTLDYTLLSGGTSVTAGTSVQYFVVAQDTAPTPNVGVNSASFTAAPSSVALTSAAFPVTGTINAYSITEGFVGTINVGTGQTFTSLSNTDGSGVFARLNGGVLTGNLVVNVTSDLTAETGSAVLNQLTEEGTGGYTVKIQPSGGTPRVISGSATTALITLNGADRVTFDGLNTGGNSLLLRNTGTGSTLRLTNDAVSNVVTNCTVEGSSGATVMTVDSTGPVTGNDNNTISNSTIRDRSDITSVPAILISCAGPSTTITNSNFVVTNCQLTNFTSQALAITNADNVSVTGNVISQTAVRTTSLTPVSFGLTLGTNAFSQNVIRDQSTSSTFTALSLGDVRGMTVARNRIFNIDNNGGSGSTFYGVNYAGASGTSSSLTLVNNMISIVPTTAASQTIYGIRDFAFSGNTIVANSNSIYLGGTATGSATWAYQRGASTPTASTLRDNVFFNGRTGGTVAHYAVGDESANTGSWVSDYNVFVGTGTTAANFFDYGTTTTAVPFATWKTGPPTRDANSLASVAGVGIYTLANTFVSANNLHLASAAAPGVNAGVVVAGVTTDFDGETRSANRPDIGADELYPLSIALSALTTTVDPLSPPFAAGTVSYTASVPNGTASVTVTPTAQDSNATIAVRVNGGTFATVVSGQPSVPLPLTVGPNPVDIRVTAEDTTTQTYTVTITRAGVPAISIADGATTLADGTSTVDFGSTNVGVGVGKTFTVTNTGTADLLLGAITVDGAQASEFVAGAPGSATITAGNSTTFTITFTPTAANARNAAVHVASNVSGATNPFDFLVTGNGVVVGVAPLITSANTTTFQLNAAGSFQAMASGTPAPTFSFTGTLPGGVTLTSGGLLSGTPMVGGTFPITITATNGTAPNATQNFTLIVNRPPVAGADSMSTRKNTAATITSTRLRINDSDPDGDTITITSVSGSSSQGGTVSLSGSTVTYTPATGYTGADAFTYQLADGRGGFATGTVSVTVTPGDDSLRTESITMSGGSVTVVYAGVPGYAYQVQTQDTMNGPWANAGPPITADSTGRVTFVDPSPPPTRFYRAIAP